MQNITDKTKFYLFIHLAFVSTQNWWQNLFIKYYAVNAFILHAYEKNIA